MEWHYTFFMTLLFQIILGCIRKLPSDDSNSDQVPNYGLLDDFLAEKFGEKDIAGHIK